MTECIFVKEFSFQGGFWLVQTNFSKIKIFFQYHVVELFSSKVFRRLDPVAKSADSAFSALDWAIQNTDQEVFHLLVSHMKDGAMRSLVQLAFCATVEEEEPSDQFEILLTQLTPTEVALPHKSFIPPYIQN